MATPLQGAVPWIVEWKAPHARLELVLEQPLRWDPPRTADSAASRCMEDMADMADMRSKAVENVETNLTLN